MIRSDVLRSNAPKRCLPCRQCHPAKSPATHSSQSTVIMVYSGRRELWVAAVRGPWGARHHSYWWSWSLRRGSPSERSLPSGRQARCSRAAAADGGASDKAHLSRSWWWWLGVTVGGLTVPAVTTGGSTAGWSVSLCHHSSTSSPPRRRSSTMKSSYSGVRRPRDVPLRHCTPTPTHTPPVTQLTCLIHSV